MGSGTGWVGGTALRFRRWAERGKGLCFILGFIPNTRLLLQCIRCQSSTEMKSRATRARTTAAPSGLSLGAADPAVELKGAERRAPGTTPPHTLGKGSHSPQTLPCGRGCRRSNPHLDRPLQLPWPLGAAFPEEPLSEGSPPQGTGQRGVIPCPLVGQSHN